MQPTAATTRFFEMPELVGHLTCHFLDHKSISGLMRTSRHLYALCTPGLFYHVLAEYDAKKQNLLASKESIEALARNVHHVRHLELDILNMVYYVNCVFAHLDQDQPSTLPPADVVVTEKEKAQDQEVTTVSRPRWLAPPDPRICAIFPVPPMTLLTRLYLNMRYSTYLNGCPYYLPSCGNPRVTLAQACWLLNLNPHLLDLRLDSVFMKGQRDIRLLTKSISGLKRLQNVKLDYFIWDGIEEQEEGGMNSTEAATRRLALAIFFSCPPSLRTLHVGIKEDNDSWMNQVMEEYWDLDLEQLQSLEISHGNDSDGEGDEEEYNLAIATPHSQKEVKAHLTSVQFCSVGGGYLSEDELRGMLALCPNLTDIVIPSISSINPQQLAQDIAQKLCPKLTTLHKGHNSNWMLMVRILEALPAQQVQEFNCLESAFVIPGLSSHDIGSMFRRHSQTLRVLKLKGWRDIDSKTIQVILVECVALEQLDVHFWNVMMIGPQQQQQQRQQRWTLCIDLDDAIEFPWGCTNIRDLSLTITIPDEPFRHLGKGEAPYYVRSFPAIPTEAEAAQFRSLEALYRQLGALTELERLDLKAVYYDPTGSRPVSGLARRNSFPGMLNLRNDETGRPGYLHHLGRLKKLKALFGSVSATTEETRETIGMEEVKWMDEHWPALERAHFFASKNENMFTKPFQWLLKQRAGSDKPVQLAASY